MARDWRELTGKLRDGNKRALARTITLIEDETPEASKIIEGIYPETGDARIVGITGPPGSGKSTLVDRMVDKLRDGHAEIGIIAVDPTSPFSGGAFLGDRARMSDRGSGEGTFFRSMGTRGASGGLCRTIFDVVNVMDVYGMDIILVETVGAGQNEVTIVEAADTCLVVIMPETGDEIQCLKAGILEIGDIFVVNKADLDGSDRMVNQVRMMVEMRKEGVRGTCPERNSKIAPPGELGGWEPPVLETVATEGKGVDELVESIEKHFEYLEGSGELERRREERGRKEVMNILTDLIAGRIDKDVEADEMIEGLMRKVTVEKKMTPRTAAKKLLSRLEW